MYLLLSIAAADLWGGLALVLERRGSGDFVLLTPRRIFGACLLLTFGTLIGASTRVLFYSSSEDVHLVLEAAAVLFIADVVSFKICVGAACVKRKGGSPRIDHESGTDLNRLQQGSQLWCAICDFSSSLQRLLLFFRASE